MRILVIGGSSFVGRAIARVAIDRGHDVTLFNRGLTDPQAFPEADHIRGDRNGDLSGLARHRWDATIDVCGYTSGQVRSLLASLGDRGGHYAFISSMAVYRSDSQSVGLTEDSPLAEPVWDGELSLEAYGALKVGCELAAAEVAGDRLLVIRPGLVIGPVDPTHRFTYWVERVASGRSPMAAPDPDQPMQAVDARDLGSFTVEQVEKGTVDTFHVSGPDPAIPFSAALQTIASALGCPLPTIRWVGAGAELPMTWPREAWPIMQASGAKARSAGFSPRPIPETVRDTYAWVAAARSEGRYIDPGPSAEDEARLLANS